MRYGVYGSSIKPGWVEVILSFANTQQNVV